MRTYDTNQKLFLKKKNNRKFYRRPNLVVINKGEKICQIVNVSTTNVREKVEELQKIMKKKKGPEELRRDVGRI